MLVGPRADDAVGAGVTALGATLLGPGRVRHAGAGHTALGAAPDPARATAANRSSMLQDALRGAATEVATINGAVAREGARLGVPTPLNVALAALVEALEATAEARVAV